MKKKISITIEEKLLKGIDHFVDGLIIRNRSQAIEHLMDKGISKRKTAVILANGLVTRVNKKDHFRVLGKIKNEPIIETEVRKLRKHNFRNIYIVGEKNLNAEIFKIFGNGSIYGVDIEYIDENGVEGDHERLKLLKGKLKNTFLVIPGENLFDINLDDFYKFHIKNGGLVTLSLTSNKNPAKKYSNVKLEGTKIVDYIEKPNKISSHIVSSGIFIAEPELLEYPGKWFPYNVFPQLVKKSLLYGFIFSGYWLDINSKKDFENAKKYIRKELN